MLLKKDMRLGNKIFFTFISVLLVFNFLKADEKIISTPLINVEKIKPSFEEQDDDNETFPG